MSAARLGGWRGRCQNIRAAQSQRTERIATSVSTTVLCIDSLLFAPLRVNQNVLWQV